MLSTISLIPLSNVSLSVVCLLFRLFLLLFCLRISRWHNGPEETVSSSQVYSCCVLKFDFLLTVTRTCTNFVTISSYMLCKANIESLINYKGARITHLHFHDKFHQQRRSNVPSFEHCHCCRKQIPCIVTIVTWPQSNASSHCHLLEAKQCFLPCKEEDKLLHPRKMSKSSHNTCKHYRTLILSYSNVYVRDQALPRPVCNALTTPCEAR